MIRDFFEHLLKPKKYALYLYCRECNQRLDTKFLITAEAKEFLKLWNNYHDHDKDEE